MGVFDEYRALPVNVWNFTASALAAAATSIKLAGQTQVAVVVGAGLGDHVARSPRPHLAIADRDHRREPGRGWSRFVHGGRPVSQAGGAAL